MFTNSTLCDKIFMVSIMTKKVAVINDLSGFGKCSLVTSISILSVMGVQACPVPTAVLTNQTGYKNYYSYDFSKHLHNYIEIWKANGIEFDGIYSGYVANEMQIDFISQFISELGSSNTKIIVDPVMGDNGSIYSSYNRQTCNKIRSLVNLADIITPNLTELCLLSDCDYSSLIGIEDDDVFFEKLTDLAHSALRHSTQQIIVTGISRGEYVCNGLFSGNESFFEKQRLFNDSFSGTGDIFASIICGAVLNEMDIKLALKVATDFIQTAIADTVSENKQYDRNDGINFEKYLYSLGNIN